MYVNNMSLNKRGNYPRSYSNNMSSSKEQEGAGQRIRLRRNITKQQVIQKNLSHMQQSAQKKKVAQELYYSQQDSRSPLLRSSVVDNKPSVHNRLGHNKTAIAANNRVKIRSQTGKRVKLRRAMQPDHVIKNNIIKRRNDKMRRMQSAQNRILRIRQTTQNEVKHVSPNNAPQKVRLRRMRPTPVNYTVQISNSGKAKQSSFKHSVNNVLNPKLQEEIRLIQNKNQNHDEIPSIPIHPQGIGFTHTSLHERFSQL